MDENQSVFKVKEPNRLSKFWFLLSSQKLSVKLSLLSIILVAVVVPIVANKNNSQTLKQHASGFSNTASFLQTTLISQGAGVTALSANPSYPASNVVDGNTSTSWNSYQFASNSNSPWIELNLHSPHTLSYLRLLVNQYPNGYTIHNIYAGSTPHPTTLIKQLKGNTQINQWLEIKFDQPIKNVQYIRVETIQSPSYVSWSEIQAFEPASSTQKMAITDFYWWYPWYGAQYKDSSGNWKPAKDNNGYLGQDAFPYVQFSNPIPYLKSSEHPNGKEDDTVAIAWFRANFDRAAQAGIDSMAVMTRPDLPEWIHALQLMIQAQKELEAEGKPYPKLLLHLDGVEYWHNPVPNPGDLTHDGVNFQTIWSGVKQTFDTIFATLPPQDIGKYFVLYGNINTFPIFVYRVEGGDINFTSNDWWVTQLKVNFEQTYPGNKLYMVLDQLWCAGKYGVGNHIYNQTCNADNYYFWGGAASGAVIPQMNNDSLVNTGNTLVSSHPPFIVTVGPGFKNQVPRNNGTWYQTNLQKAKSLDADWLLLETFNLGEEGTVLDNTTQYGSLYLNLTKNFLSNWKGNSTLLFTTPTQLPINIHPIIQPITTTVPTSLPNSYPSTTLIPNSLPVFHPIEGTVTDGNGNAQIGLSVVVTDITINQQQIAYTNTNGYYQIPKLVKNGDIYSVTPINFTAAPNAYTKQEAGQTTGGLDCGIKCTFIRIR